LIFIEIRSETFTQISLSFSIALYTIIYK